VIGLGKLGAPLAAVLAGKGHGVLGIDVNPATVQLLNDGIAPVDEPDVQKLISASQHRLRATTELEAAAEAEMSILLVPTPSDDRGAFSSGFVLDAVQRVGRALAGRDDYHVMVIASTVMPGSCESEILQTLERASGRRVGETVGLCYSPEFIALGSVVRDMLHPDMVLIGESDPRAGDAVERLYRGVCENDPPFRRMSLVNAELTKIAVNTFVTMKISYANTLADLCERLPNADVDVVTGALGLDTRIGSKYLRGALPYGGPCFPRDNKAFATLARDLSTQAPLAEATDEVNVGQIDRLARTVESRLGVGDSVGILGLAYKPGTSVVEESPGIGLARLLAEAGREIYVYDPNPAALSRGLELLAGTAEGVPSARELVARSDIAVIATPWAEFAQLSREAFEPAGKRRVVVDCWRLLARGDDDGELEIVHPGRALEQSSGVRAA
jgi:UDPglucose 6-dehydrogenase